MKNSLFVSRNPGGRWFYAMHRFMWAPGSPVKVLGRRHPDVFIVVSRLEPELSGGWAFVVSRLGPGWIWIADDEAYEDV